MKSIMSNKRFTGFKILLGVVMLCAMLIPVSTAMADPPQGFQAHLYISPSTQNPSAGQSFTVDVRIDVGQGMTRGAQTALSFNPAVVQCTGFSNAVTPGTFYYDWAVAHGAMTMMMPLGTINNTTGNVSTSAIFLQGADADGGPSGDGLFIRFNFTAIADGYSNIHISNAVVSDVVGNSLTLATTDGEVWVGTIPVPNLVILDKWEVELGAENYEIHYIVKNIGGATAGASTVCITIDSVQVAAQPCPPLSPDQQVELTSGPYTVTDGNDAITVCADCQQQVSESNETDNCQSNTYAVVKMESTTTFVGNPICDIEIFCPPDVLDWDLGIGDNCLQALVHVNCNGEFQVTASDKNPLTNGHMTEWDGTQYLSRKLANPLRIGNSTCPCSVVGALSSPQLIIEDNDCAGQGTTGEDYPVCVNQVVTWGDNVLPGNHVYRIVVTFTAVQTSACN